MNPILYGQLLIYKMDETLQLQDPWFDSELRLEVCGVGVHVLWVHQFPSTY